MHCLQETFKLKSPNVGVSVLDEVTVTQAQITACEAIHTILNTHSHTASAAAAGASGADATHPQHSHKHYLVLKQHILSLCASHRLMVHLQSLATKSFVCASLFGELFEMRENNFNYTSPSVLSDCVLTMLDSEDVNIRIVAVRVLCAGVLHSRESRLHVILHVPRLQVACFLEQLIASGFAHLQKHTFQSQIRSPEAEVDPEEPPPPTAEENNLVSDTLVAAFIVITNLFAQRVDMSPRSQSAITGTQSFASSPGGPSSHDIPYSDAELEHLASACDGLITTILMRTPKPNELSRHYHLAKQALGTQQTQPLEANKFMLANDIITKNLWQALENLAGVKICAYVLLHKSKVGVMSLWTLVFQCYFLMLSVV